MKKSSFNCNAKQSDENRIYLKICKILNLEDDIDFYIKNTNFELDFLPYIDFSKLKNKNKLKIETIIYKKNAYKLDPKNSNKLICLGKVLDFQTDADNFVFDYDFDPKNKKTCFK